MQIDGHHGLSLQVEEGLSIRHHYYKVGARYFSSENHLRLKSVSLDS
jgi:hypothetical protein